MRDTNVNAFHALNQGDEEQEPESRALGDIVQMYDVCGRLGLCPECRARGVNDLRQGCQGYYVFSRVRGTPG